MFENKQYQSDQGNLTSWIKTTPIRSRQSHIMNQDNPNVTDQGNLTSWIKTIPMSRIKAIRCYGSLLFYF